ncbi:MAG: hypothetical protein HC921_21050 [Synechococcaceae cyanobacterium SM2_3_1]|nr:hypothetical protein [Synechococcaceae cyanobacterium SM2_3_1]
MRREDGTPFRFIKDAETPLPKYFIQAVFRFDSNRSDFVWECDLHPPTQEIPGYRKPRKPGDKHKKDGKKTYKPKKEATLEGQASADHPIGSSDEVVDSKIDTVSPETPTQ